MLADKCDRLGFMENETRIPNSILLATGTYKKSNL